MQGVIIAVRLSVHLGPTDSKLKALSTRLEVRRGEERGGEKRRGGVPLTRESSFAVILFSRE